MQSPDIVEKVLAVVSEGREVTPEEIRGPSHERRIVVPRNAAVWLLSVSGLTPEQIGAELGGRDRSTIAKIRRAAEADVESSDFHRAFFYALANRCGIHCTTCHQPYPEPKLVAPVQAA